MHVIECTTLIVDNKYYIEVETDLLLQLLIASYSRIVFSKQPKAGQL